LKAPGFNPGTYEFISWFQAFAFKRANLCRYTEVSKEVREASASAAAAAAVLSNQALSNQNQGLKVLTPPLQVPATSAHAHRAMMKSGLGADFADGLTDDDREGGMTPDYSASPGAGAGATAAAAARPRKLRQSPVPSGAAAGETAAKATAAKAAAAMLEGPVPPRVAGDVDDIWMAFHDAAAAAAKGGSTGAGGSDGCGDVRVCGRGGGRGGVGSYIGGGGEGGGGGCPELTCDADFHRWSDEYNAHYGMYIAMHGALEANALEFRALMQRRDAAVVGGGGGREVGSGAEVGLYSC
jgi:hypothetical protein